MSEKPEGTPVLKKPAGPVRLVTAACIMALIGIAFTLAHFIWPIPLLFALFMIVGQGAFGLGMLLYAIAILTDLKRQKVL
ncbi:MAG TPA: hypothetical protein VKU80_11465 [Planctomycetota bacterium]|nr:hypothetical protein [Planctomycetota bacterium]